MIYSYHIARLQLTRVWRRQLYVVPLAVGIVMLALPAYVNAFSMGLAAFSLVTRDFALGLLSWFGLAVALLLGSSAVPGDVEGKTIYPLLSRPLGRFHYIAGQLAAVAFSVALSLLFSFAALQLGMLALGAPLDLNLLWAALSYTLQSIVVASACLCCSLFCSPPLAGVLGLALFVVGGLSESFIQFFIVQDRGAAHIANAVRGAQRALPHFEFFELKYPVEFGFPIHPALLGAQAFYALGWMLVFALAATLIFESKDL